MRKRQFFPVMMFLAVFSGAAFWAVPACAAASVEQAPVKPLEDLLRMAWAASSSSNYTELDGVIQTIQGQYEPEAMAQSASLTAFPVRDKVDGFKTMNGVATAFFVRAEALMHQGRNVEAIRAFETLIKDYPYAQSWDASRGSYWSVAEKSHESVNVMKGVEELDKAVLAPETKPVIAAPGDDAVIDYSKYGTFTGIGTVDYKYTITNPNVLSKAVGEGIYPNTADVMKNPGYREAFKQGRLNGSHWDLVNTRDLEASYFKWATAPEQPGVKLYYTGLTLEKTGLLLEAIKAYHALVVHFPRSTGMTYWHTPWYPAQAAVGKIKNILRQHPELGLVYRNAKVRVVNGDDNDTANDSFIVFPGEIVSGNSQEMKHRELGEVRRELGGSKTKFVQYASGDWQMFVDGQPYMIKGITYMPTTVGQSPDKNTVANWMLEDTNGNGRIDAPYESWVDANRNNIQDADEPVVGDFQLMKEMGVNTVRVYHQPRPPVKAVLRDLYEHYGISVIMGDFLGKYALGSGAEWGKGGTDYENPEHQAAMMASVEKIVNEYKAEPFVIMWLLGNENNYGVASNGDKKPEAYFAFANKVAKRIKELDPTRPVAICNGDVLFIDKFAKYAPDIDVFGANVYRGDYGFSSFWDQVRTAADKPAFITEYGAPAYSKQVGLDVAEEQQAAYHRGAWLDIMANATGHVDGEGNAVGGVAFEWLDEWWKNYEPFKHDTKADVIGPFVGGYYFEEWFGLVGQGDGSASPFLRQPRKSYYMYKDFWNRAM